MVLSGQHSLKCLLVLQKEWIQQYGHDALPDSLRSVRCDVLKFGTPLEQRVLIAGNEQYRQEGISRIPISWWCHHLLQSNIEDRSLTDMVIMAVQKSGYKRLENKVC